MCIVLRKLQEVSLSKPEYRNKMNPFDKIYDKIISDLENNLPAYLTYHCPDHTRLVLEKTILIAEMEMVSDRELLLLKIAAIYHDTGYLNSVEDHEVESCKIAESQLPEFGFGKTEISQICGMIMATKIPQQPKSRLEGILADADLEYLGTSEFEVISEKLYTEMKHFKPDLTLNQWYNIQINFISKHHFHTAYCLKNRDLYKSENLRKIKEKALLLS